MRQWHNREKAVETLKATTLNKRKEKYALLSPICRICGITITFDQFCLGRKNLCENKECRSSINRQNSLKQDKTKISEYIRRSEKWTTAQRESLLRTRSRIEESYSKILHSLFDDVKCQVHIKIPGNKHRFADFVVNGVVIEIDGPYHEESRDAILNEYCLDKDIPIIRIDVTRHWTEIFGEVGEVIQKIRALSSA